MHEKKLLSTSQINYLNIQYTIIVKIGYNLINIIDKPNSIQEQLGKLRTKFICEFGIFVPLIRIEDDLNNNPDEFSILIHGKEIFRLDFNEFHNLMILHTKCSTISKKIAGEVFSIPIFDLSGKFLSKEQAASFQDSGIAVYNRSEFIIETINLSIKKNLHLIMGRDEYILVLNQLKEINIKLYKEWSAIFDVYDFQRICIDYSKNNGYLPSIKRIMESMLLNANLKAKYKNFFIAVSKFLN